MYLANAGINDIDLHAEYTRLEPYVYSNRLEGNAFSNGEFGLGHRLEPNSDEWLVRIVARPSASLRGSAGFRKIRHGANVVENGVVTVNVGGDLLAGHRAGDPDGAAFLAGRLTETRVFEVRAWYEPVTNLIFSAGYEVRRHTSPGGSATDHLFGVRGTLEF